MKPYYLDVASAYTPHILACGSYQAHILGFAESSKLRFLALGYLLGDCPPEAMDSPSLRSAWSEPQIMYTSAQNFW